MKEEDKKLEYPRRISEVLGRLVRYLDSDSDITAITTLFSSFYGLCLGAGYGLCKSYRQLLVQQAKFFKSEDYINQVRKTLHLEFPKMVQEGDTTICAAELVSLNINTSQHFLHILLDRILNALLVHLFKEKEKMLNLVYYNHESLRISLLRWRVEGDDNLRSELIKLDESFNKWLAVYQPGSCNKFVVGIINNPEVKPPPDHLKSLEKGVRFMLGDITRDVRGSIAYLVDRTNEAKHLPEGTGRAQLVIDLADSERVRRLYEVEWMLTFLAFESMMGFVDTALNFIKSSGYMC